MVELSLKKEALAGCAHSGRAEEEEGPTTCWGAARRREYPFSEEDDRRLPPALPL